MLTGPNARVVTPSEVAEVAGELSAIKYGKTDTDGMRKETRKEEVGEVADKVSAINYGKTDKDGEDRQTGRHERRGGVEGYRSGGRTK